MSPRNMALMACILSLFILIHSSHAVPHSIYTNFAEPLGGFTMDSRSFDFVTEDELKTTTVTASDHAVYRYGFISFDGQPWEMFELLGTALGGDWLTGSVSANIEFNPSDFRLDQGRLSTQNNFIVVYSCSRTLGTWNCHDGWQIWQFNATLEEAGPPAWQDGLLSWWKLDGNADDDIGNNDGTNHGATEVSDCVSGGCYDFDGIDDYVSTSELISNPQEFSVAAWFRTSVSEGRKVVGFENDQTGTLSSNWDRHIYVDTSGDAVFGCHSGSMVVDVATSAASISDGEWHHVVGVRDDTSDDILIYVDGTFHDSAPNANAEVFDGYWRMGSYKTGPYWPGGDNGYFEGQIDEVMVFDTALSAIDVQDLYDYFGYVPEPGYCGDTRCNNDETCTSCPEDCGSCPSGNDIDVIGPHEFWTHENAQNGDYVGYVKFFDMSDFTPVFSEVSDTSGGAFSIDSATGLITVSDPSSLVPSSTYTYRVKIEEPGVQEGETDVIIHVADESDVIYINSSAPDGGDGSYEAPYDSVDEDIGTVTSGIYLLSRGSVFYDGIYIQDPTTSASNPVVVGAYGKGNKPILDGSQTWEPYLLESGSWYGDYAIIAGQYAGTEDDITSYVYIQNIEVRNWEWRGITTGRIGHHHITFLDIYVHHSATWNDSQTGWWMWDNSYSGDPEDLTEDLNMLVVNCESSYNGLHSNGNPTNQDDYSGSGTKWGAGGLRIYNFVAHDNRMTGIRLLGEQSPIAICKGCVSYENGRAGFQLRSPDTILEYFKSYDNANRGVYIWQGAHWIGTVSNFRVMHGESHGNYDSGGYDDGIHIEQHVQDITIEDVLIYGNEAGIAIEGTDNTQNITIRDCLIRNNLAEGISVSDDGTTGEITEDVYIQDNEIHDNAGDAIFLERVDNVYVENNVFYGNNPNEIVQGPGVTNFHESGNQFL